MTDCKVLILVPDLRLAGGIANYYKTLALDSFPNITYFVNSDGRSSHIKTFYKLIFQYLSFPFTLIKNNYQVIIVNPSLEGKGKSFFRELIFILISLLFRRKIIVFFRGWSENFEKKIKNSRLKSFLFRISYAKAERFIVLGKIFKLKLINLGVSEKATFEIETTVADSAYLKDFNIENKFSSYEKEIAFLFLSRVERIKGIYIAVDAFHAFQLKNPTRKSLLYIAGEGSALSDVKLYIKENSIYNVNFLGLVSGDKKKQILLNSHVLLFPSFTEGLPNTILEAMLYGMPIITRATGAIPEIVNHRINGYLTKSFDYKIFSNFLSEIAINKKLYMNIGVTNNKIAREKFITEKVKDRFVSIIEVACKNH